MTDKPTATRDHMPFPGSIPCSAWMIFPTPVAERRPAIVEAQNYHGVEPRNQMLLREDELRAKRLGR